MSLVQGKILQKYVFSFALWNVFCLHGIVDKYAAAIFFPTEDYVSCTIVGLRSFH